MHVNKLIGEMTSRVNGLVKNKIKTNQMHCLIIPYIPHQINKKNLFYKE